jgi:hypothetical protein
MQKNVTLQFGHYYCSFIINLPTIKLRVWKENGRSIYQLEVKSIFFSAAAALDSFIPLLTI